MCVSTETKLVREEIAWITGYAATVTTYFESIFGNANDRFNDGPRLVERFKRAVEKVLKDGRGNFRAVDETHNELCVAAAILQNPNPQFVMLDYEPALYGCAKTIDFRVTTVDGATVFVDVKTIKPVPKDRWEQFERALKEGWLSENVRVTLSKEWLGGEIWHEMFAARSRMLEYTLELEQKIANCQLQAERTSFVLMLCGEGFYWHKDELEDFVSFYFMGRYRSDDPFSKAEAKYIEEKKLSIAKTVSRFACMRRPKGDVEQKRLNWNVQPPHDPCYQ
jgi:hypothetical protein